MAKGEHRPFDPVNCVFKEDCIKYKTPDCKDPCWRIREFYYLIDNSNLPEKHKYDTRLIPADIDLPVFEYLDYVKRNIREFVSEGNNLIIQGSTGTGKSCWATKLLRQYLMEVSISNGFNLRALFVNVPWFIAELKHNISDRKDVFNELRRNCYLLDLIVFDDLGATSINSDFIHDELYAIINHRADSLLSTIYTTNLSDKELEQNLGARIATRVLGISEIVKISSTIDLRRPDSEFSFKNFVKGKLNNEE